MVERYVPKAKRAAQEQSAQQPTQQNGTHVYVSTEKLTEKQREAWKFLQGGQRHSLLYGGARGGKTVVICKAIVARAIKARGSRHAILRFKANSVWPSIGMDTMPNVFKTFYPNLPYEMRERAYFYLPATESEIWLGGLDDKERVDKILGREYITTYFNECSQIPYNSVLVALSRLAQVVRADDPTQTIKQRAYYDLNPVGKGHWANKLFLEKKLLDGRSVPDPENYQAMQINPIHNKDHLSPEYLQSLELYPPRQRMRFLEGIFQDETEGALWSFEGIETLRISKEELPELSRIVVAVDPSGAKDKNDFGHDEIGIAVVGLGVDGHGYLLEDASVLDGPAGWGRRVVSLFHKYSADHVVGEVNYGGAMVQYVIHSVDSSIPFKMVTASRGKAIRAEPVSTLASTEDGTKKSGWRLHHVGTFRKLEEELTNFTSSGYVGSSSPNRADAYIWAVTDLMVVGTNAQGWVEFYEKMSAQARGVRVEKKLKPGEKPQPYATLRSPEPHQNFMFGAGKVYSSDESCMVYNVPPDDVPMLLKVGCVPLV